MRYKYFKELRKWEKYNEQKIKERNIKENRERIHNTVILITEDTLETDVYDNNPIINCPVCGNKIDILCCITNNVLNCYACESTYSLSIQLINKEE